MGIRSSLYTVRSAGALLSAVLACLGAAASVGAQTASHLTIQVDKPGVRISPMFYGLMTEEINHSYDGGLYGELVQNRSFKDSGTSATHWSLVTSPSSSGEMSLVADHSPENKDWTALRLDAGSIGPQGRIGVANDGFWGIPVWPNTTYHASFYARTDSYSGKLTVSLEGASTAETFASGSLSLHGPAWRKYSVTLRTGAVRPSSERRLVLSLDKPGTVWLDQVSLFAPTYRNRPNGNRIDLMRKLGEMRPSFLRLPGGNYLEGNTTAERFDWKATIGDVAERPGHQGPWGYRSSDGLGLLEFLDWCEDLHMQPVLAVFAGYALRGEHTDAGPKLQPFVQDALDEIEYVTGEASTTWGSVRAKSGHRRPFPLTYVEIGNEDQFDRSRSYDGRFTQFYDAIKAKYPKLQIIATTPVQSRKPDVVDDHYYRSADDMARDAGHYDAISRSGPKIFVGEWASTEGAPTPTLKAALGDAAWLTGLERNSDLVVMEAYAPLLVNVNRGASQWGTNLIGYDALTSFGSPSFLVQSIFAKNTGNVVLPSTLYTAVKPKVAVPPHGGIGVGTWATDAEYKDIEVTNTDGTVLYKSDFSQGTSGWTLRRGSWKIDDGALRQRTPQQDSQATTGDPNWNDYTLRLKARKLGGAEGFFVQFHVQDGKNFWQWNVGGWDNTRSAIQRIDDGSAQQAGRRSLTTVETNQWYDLRIEVKDHRVRCYMDDKLINEAVEQPQQPVNPLYVATSRDESTGDVILKVVNISANRLPLEVDLVGVSEVEPEATGWIIAGEPGDINTVELPNKVRPAPIRLDGIGKHFSTAILSHSVTVLRLKVKT